MVKYEFYLKRSVRELKTFSAFEPICSTPKSLTIYLSSKGSHLIGFGIFLIVDADPSNIRIYFTYFCIVISSFAGISEVFATKRI